MPGFFDPMVILSYDLLLEIVQSRVLNGSTVFNCIPSEEIEEQMVTGGKALMVKPNSHNASANCYSLYVP